MKVSVQVLQSICIPAGSTLDGVKVTKNTVVSSGVHQIDRGLMVANLWDQYGYIEPESVNGKPVSWDSCCTDH